MAERNQYMSIAFIGGVFPKELYREIAQNSKGLIQNAANNFQWKIIQGLECNLGKPIDLLNAMFVGVFPMNYRKMWVRPPLWQHRDGANDTNVSFFNLFALRNFSREHALKEAAQRWIKLHHNGDRRYAIAYSLHSPFLGCLGELKRLDTSIKTCAIVPDLPEFMNLLDKKDSIYHWLKKYDIRTIQQRLEYVDCFVLLTEPMKDRLNFGGKPYLVMEGISDRDLMMDETHGTWNGVPHQHKIVYTGSLNRKYGILDLVDCFKYLSSDNYSLILCGDGDAREYILNAARQDKRIIYKGNLSAEEARREQLNGTLLVNPRTNEGEYTKYSFPSKLMEFLSSGIPVLAHKLDGVPDEYDQYYSRITGIGPQSIANCIKEICEHSYEEKRQVAQKARDYVIREKNAQSQTQKILDMLASLQ